MCANAVANDNVADRIDDIDGVMMTMWWPILLPANDANIGDRNVIRSLLCVLSPMMWRNNQQTTTQ